MASPQSNSIKELYGRWLVAMGEKPDMDLDESFTDASVWDDFEPGLISLCSPDPQAFRPPEEKNNFLHVGLPTNFKASAFEDDSHTAMLKKLEEY